MSIGAWILLITVGLGMFGTLVYLLLSFPATVPATATKALPAAPRPVWMVLLDGGTVCREGYHDPDDGLDDERDPQAPLSPYSGCEITRDEQQATPENAGHVGSLG